jgi:hypothetical protein
LLLSCPPASAGAFLCVKNPSSHARRACFPIPNAGIDEFYVEAMDELTRLSPEITQHITDIHSGVPRNCREVVAVEEQQTP